jgi:uncharacterized membrane protein YcfT
MHPQKGGPVGGRRKGGKKPQTEALKADMRKRYWEIDALRGLCVVVMIVYHTLFNLADFGFTDMDFLGRFSLVLRAGIRLYIYADCRTIPHPALRP